MVLLEEIREFPLKDLPYESTKSSLKTEIFKALKGQVIRNDIIYNICDETI